MPADMFAATYDAPCLRFYRFDADAAAITLFRRFSLLMPLFRAAAATLADGAMRCCYADISHCSRVMPPYATP